jgi:hypothetical protein
VLFLAIAVQQVISAPGRVAAAAVALTRGNLDQLNRSYRHYV